MSLEKVKEYLEKFGVKDRVLEFPVSSATVELAAKAAGTEPARICKTLSFLDANNDEGCILVQIAGDRKIKSAKFKQNFGFKAKMLPLDLVEVLTGHPVGGVCAFAIENPNVKIYADISLKKYSTVFPACGSSNSAIELSPDELFEYSRAIDWVDLARE